MTPTDPGVVDDWAPPRAKARRRVRVADLMAVVAGVALCCRWPTLLPLGLPALAWYAATLTPPRAGDARWFHTVALPVCWFVGAWVAWSHPGDEYGMFIVGALPGVWVFTFLTAGDTKTIIPIVLGGGAVALALFGRALDCAGVWKPAWLVPAVLLTPALVGWMINQYPSLDRAVSKNGSVTAYVAFAWNLSVCGAAVLALLVTLGGHVVRGARRRWAG